MEIIDGYMIEEKKKSGGSFGVIKKCEKNGKKYAVKIIERNGTIGIDNLMELSIMSSFKHPCLNRCKHIHVSNTHIYIFQKLAQCDLEDRINNSKPYTMKEIKNWLYQITHAIGILHKHNITHCDIKTCNILYYSDDKIKVTDFGESVKTWNSKIKYSHQTGSPAFKSPETLISKTWTEKTDIWSLGCVFYQVYTGKRLFGFNGEYSENYLLAFEDFFSTIDDFDHKITVKEGYRAPHINRDIINDMDVEFFKLLIRMLERLPNKRPSCVEILKSPFFKRNSIGKCKIKRHVVSPTIFNVANLPKHNIDNPILKKVIFKLTGRILATCSNVKLNQKGKLYLSFFIACKLILSVKDLPYIPLSLLKYEHLICSNINYKLFIL